MAQYMKIATILSVHFSQLLLLFTIFQSTESSSSYPKACRVDIAFVLDASEYVGTSQWTKTLSFLKNFAVPLDFGQKREQARISVVTYGSGHDVDIELNQHTDVFSLAAAIDALSIQDGISDLASRLSTVRNHVFGTEGDRKYVPNVAVIIMDRIPTNLAGTIAEVGKLISSGIMMFGLGVGDIADLSRFANNRMRFINTESYDTLNGMAETLANAVCRVRYIKARSRAKRDSDTAGDATSGANEPAPTTPKPAEKRGSDPVIKQSCLADLAFVLDSSGSVMVDGWRKMMKFMKEFTEALEIGQDTAETSVGVVSFESQAKLHFGFDRYKSVSSLHQAIDRLDYKAGETNLAAGLRVMRTDLFQSTTGDRPEAPNIAILITDGVPTKEVDQTFIEARNARDANIIIFGIGIGPEYNKSILERIANKPQSNFVFFYDDFMKLVDQVDVIMGKACDPTITTPCGASDVALLLDSSGSIGKENWKKTQTFVKDFTSNLLPFGSYGNQVAVISFSTKSEINAHLNTFDNYRSFANMVDRIEHRNHRTNISGAIRLMYEDIFNDQKGDRPDHGNIALLLTDGHGNIDDHLTEAEATTAHKKGITMIVVGIGKESAMSELKKIVSVPKHSNMILIEEFSDLVNKAKEVFLQACSKRSPKPTLEEAECSGDIVIVLDVGSNFQDWNNLIRSLMEFVNMLLDANPPIGVGHRVALVVTAEGKGADEDYIVYLDDYVNMKKFRNVPRWASRSDTGKSLEYVRNNVFRPSNKDRRNAQNVVILLTDGRSSLRSEKARSEAQKLLLEGVIIYTIGFGSAVRKSELTAISSSPASYFVKVVPGIYSLTELVVDMKLSVCYATAKLVWFCSIEDQNNVGSFCGASQNGWQIGEHETESTPTGPSAAHTGLKYAYIDASNEPRKKYGETAVLRLPQKGASGHHCLYFQYHMFGFHQGALQVFIEHKWEKTLVWTLSGEQNNQWNFAAVQLNLPQSGKILITATLIEGHLGDTALDDIRLTKGPCLPLD